MSPFPHDLDDPIRERPQGRPGDPHHASPLHEEDAPLIAGLVRLVTERARAAGEAHPGNPRPMERLREAVDALGHTLDALELLRDANMETAGEAPPRATPERRGGATRAPIPWGDPPARAMAGTAPPRDGPAFAPFRDQVTGLHSWAGFESLASGELRRCLRRDRSFTVLRLRPGTGDPQALRLVAQRLRNRVRASDHIGYHADRGFMFALAETDREEAAALSGRLVDALHGPGRGGEPRIGLATYPEDGDSLAALLEVAGDRTEAPVGDGSTDTSGRSYPAG